MLTEERLKEIEKSIPRMEFLGELGRSMMIWKDIELSLFLTFHDLLEPKKSDYTFSIWGALFEIRKQYSLINAIAGSRFEENAKMLKKWQALSGRINLAIRSRNRLAHWSTYEEKDSEKGDSLFLIPNLTDLKFIEQAGKEREKLSLSKLQKISKSFSKIQRDLHAFRKLIKPEATGQASLEKEP